jgi:hypothetical protein
MPRNPATSKLKNWVLPLLTFAAALCPHVASATLGEPEVSVQTDSEKFNGSIKVSEHASYRLHEIQLPSGTLLKEFVGADGNVFAVVWSGPRAPNLRQAMGRYFDEFTTAAAKTMHPDHNHLQIQQSDLVVQSSGHMRALSGRAYLPQAIPSGLSLGEIR